METISVIVAVYNVEKYLNRCIDSILSQTYKNLEIILVDDGSKDKSGAICDEYQEKDTRIKVVHKENGGLGYARNSGLDIATGEYVTFIDGDDYIGKHHLKTMYTDIKRTGTDTCLGGHTKVYASKKVEHTNVCAGKCFYQDVKEQILPRMCGADYSGNDYIEMSVCMVLLSNKIIQENNLRFVSEKEMISEDLIFDFSYYPLSEGACCTDICDYYYCDNEGSLTNKYRSDRFTSQVKLYEAVKERARSLNIESECLPRLSNTLLAIARYSIKLECKFKNQKEAMIAISDICNDKTLEKVFTYYDYTKIKLSSKLINDLMKRKMIKSLYIVMSLRRFIKV